MSPSMLSVAASTSIPTVAAASAAMWSKLVGLRRQWGGKAVWCHVETSLADTEWLAPHPPDLPRRTLLSRLLDTPDMHGSWTYSTVQVGRKSHSAHGSQEGRGWGLEAPVRQVSPGLQQVSQPLYNVAVSVQHGMLNIVFWRPVN